MIRKVEKKKERKERNSFYYFFLQNSLNRPLNGVDKRWRGSNKVSKHRVSEGFHEGPHITVKGQRYLEVGA